MHRARARVSLASRGSSHTPARASRPPSRPKRSEQTAGRARAPRTELRRPTPPRWEAHGACTSSRPSSVAARAQPRLPASAVSAVGERLANLSRPKRSEQTAGRARAPQTELRQLSRLMISAWLTIHTTSLIIHNLIIGYLDTTSVCGLSADSKLHPLFYDILKTHDQMTLPSELVPLQTTQGP